MNSNIGSSSKNEPNVTKPIPDFKLCFPIKQKTGFATGNYPHKVSVVTSKFYSKTYMWPYDKQDLQRHIKILINVGPKQKYKVPKTENQRYGWYEFPTLDHDLHKQMKFNKSTHQLVKEHLMNYAKIRE